MCCLIISSEIHKSHVEIVCLPFTSALQGRVWVPDYICHLGMCVFRSRCMESYKSH